MCLHKYKLCSSLPKRVLIEGEISDQEVFHVRTGTPMLEMLALWQNYDESKTKRNELRTPLARQLEDHGQHGCLCVCVRMYGIERATVGKQCCGFSPPGIGAITRGAFLLWFTRQGSCWSNPPSLPVITFTAGSWSFLSTLLGNASFLWWRFCVTWILSDSVVFRCTHLHYRKHSSGLFAKMLFKNIFFPC